MTHPVHRFKQEQLLIFLPYSASGPGLVFNVYPKAVSLMPGAPIWAVLFFFMIIMVAIDSQFVCVEGFVTAIYDQYERHLHRMRYARETLTAVICFGSFLLGVAMGTISIWLPLLYSKGDIVTPDFESYNSHRGRHLRVPHFRLLRCQRHGPPFLLLLRGRLHRLGVRRQKVVPRRGGHGGTQGQHLAQDLLVDRNAGSFYGNLANHMNISKALFTSFYLYLTGSPASGHNKVHAPHVQQGLRVPLVRAAVGWLPRGRVDHMGPSLLHVFSDPRSRSQTKRGNEMNDCLGELSHHYIMISLSEMAKCNCPPNGQILTVKRGADGYGVPLRRDGELGCQRAPDHE